MDNGATLCSKHHLEAEQTILSTNKIRETLNIKHPVLPEHFYSDNEYDKWGNIILTDGRRLRGELFYDESVQKILNVILDKFILYAKYPRTYHLPWSDSKTNDDRTLLSVEHFKGKEVVVTTKMDGENSNIYSDGYFHARSVDGHNHPSQNWLKNYIQNWYFNLPEDWRVCGENLYATHSLKYEDLENYFTVFQYGTN